jgi:hypothetical protein
MDLLNHVLISAAPLCLCVNVPHRHDLAGVFAKLDEFGCSLSVVGFWFTAGKHSPTKNEQPATSNQFSYEPSSRHFQTP